MDQIAARNHAVNGKTEKTLKKWTKEIIATVDRRDWGKHWRNDRKRGRWRNRIELTRTPTPKRASGHDKLCTLKKYLKKTNSK